jgi:glycine/D-amino acid oxidase-like deaminating enzyme
VNKQKLLIVGGGGMVGATAAYACALRSVIEACWRGKDIIRPGDEIS